MQTYVWACGTQLKALAFRNVQTKHSFLFLVYICRYFPPSLALIFGSQLLPGLSFLASGVLLVSIWPETTVVITA